MTTSEHPDESTDAGDAAPAPTGPVVGGYAEALAELESILAELESERVDIDHLAERVARGAALAEYCRSRIDAARTEVTRLVAAFDDADGGEPSR